jgi:hypothetical protein
MGENVNGLRANIMGFAALIIMTFAAGTLIYMQIFD